jgi:hypothetical protein
MFYRVLPALGGADEKRTANNSRKKIPVDVEQLKDYVGIIMHTLLSAITNIYIF